MGKEIGIDFGTSTTEVSYIDKNGYARSMRLEKNRHYLPTVLFFKSENDFIVGERAIALGRKFPQAAIKNFKLYVTDPNKKWQIKAQNGDTFSIKPLKAVQLFLNKLIQMIQPKLFKEFGERGGAIDKAVITVPALFDPEEKAAVKDAITRAGAQAGFTDVRLAAEPTAAAVAYQDENGEDGEVILVYDFGGGTFDVSVIQKSGDVYTEIATGGDKRLGGSLLTEKLAGHLWRLCLKQVDRDYPFEEEEAEEYSEEEYGLSEAHYYENRENVFQAAEELKQSFLEEDQVSTVLNFYIDDEDGETESVQAVEVTMELEEFYAMIDEEIQKTIDLTSRVLTETLSKEGIETLDQLVLAGGSSKIRLIRDKMLQHKLLKDVAGVAGESTTLISRGAAKLASVELKVEEKTRFELGTRMIKGMQFDLFEPVIRAGEKLPCKGTQVFYLSRDNQQEVTVEYYEKDVKNYPDAAHIDEDGINLVSELTIHGIPAGQQLSVWVTFSIESDGTPTITAQIKDKNGQVVKADRLAVTRGGNLY